jgi:hypothetical protein
MSKYSMGKEIGGILERLKVLESKVGCNCHQSATEKPSFSLCAGHLNPHRTKRMASYSRVLPHI